jgi:arabinogalactan oligomer/maltooligosaccharide transport system permease protein
MENKNDSISIIIALVKALLSTFVWGLGQLFNRQWAKALMFFSVFALIIFIEVSTGAYGTELDLYGEKISGDEMRPEISNGFIQDYYYNMYHGENSEFGYQYTDYTFLEYVADVNGMTLESNPWYLAYNDQGYADITSIFNQDTFVMTVENDNEVSWNAQLSHGQLQIEDGKEYQVTFDASSSVPGTIEVNLVINEDTVVTETVNVTTSLETYVVTLESTGYTPYGVLEFSFDGTVDEDYRFATDVTATFDNVSFTESNVDDSNQIKNGDFSINIPVFKKDGLQVPSSQFSTIKLTPEQLYDFLADQLIVVEQDALLGGVGDIEQVAIDEAILQIEQDTVNALLEDAIRDAKGAEDYQERLDDMVALIATEELILEGYTGDEVDFDTTLSTYIDDNVDSLIISAEGRIAQEVYDTYDAEMYNVEYNAQYKKNYTRYRLKAYTELYGEFAEKNETILAFITYLQDKFASGNLPMDSDDANKMLAHLYFAVNEDDYNDLYSRIDNMFYERAGFFVKGVWGVVTMGEVPLTSFVEHKALSFFLPSTATDALNYQEIVIEGHHSTRLLLNGIIALIALFFFSIVWIWNIRDAFNTSLKRSKAQIKQTEKEYFKELYDKFFEYIVLAPAVIVVSFISIMPILFGILVAFTNYNIEHIPPGQLIDWVGFSNFLEVFSFTSGSSIDFGGQFWKVFSWTLIWAVGATFTCFFGGFVQAVIISNKRVVFRKAWRSILILPWAVPALISQMIFRVMFQDTGYVNQVLARVGITELFMNLGFLGKTYQEAMDASALERFFHMGTDTFQWLSNDANPWFVRIFLIVLNIWLGFPFFMALMSGVMTSIDKSLYEAASIDGATGFQQFRFITLPLVLLATSPLLVMTFSGNFNNFGVIYFITGGGPGDASFTTAYAGQTDILISWIYKLTTDANIRWYNMASVFSLLIFLIIGSVSAWNFTRTRAFKEDD